jgi:hypothetical protein
MNKKNRSISRRTPKKSSKKPKKPSRQENSATKQVVSKQAVEVRPKVEPLMEKVETVREGTAFKIVINQIEGETIIGDLLVVFPRTREVLRKHGLNLDVEEAGDIYMSLDAFAALQGLNTDVLVQELEIASKVPPPAQPPVPTTMIAAQVPH